MASNIRIRVARSDDLDALGALKLRASLAWGEHVEALKALAEAARVPAEHLPGMAVAELDGQIAGFATILPGAGEEAEVEDLFVEPELWGKGVGRRLMAEIERRAVALGAKSLHVVAGEHARPFYEACGFEVVGKVVTLLALALEMRKIIQ